MMYISNKDLYTITTALHGYEIGTLSFLRNTVIFVIVLWNTVKTVTYIERQDSNTIHMTLLGSAWCVTIYGCY